MAEARQETAMETDGPVSVTTISTVAVQSGRAKIILAILKVSNWTLYVWRMNVTVVTWMALLMPLCQA